MSTFKVPNISTANAHDTVDTQGVVIIDPVTGRPTALQVTGLTNTELRATAVPASLSAGEAHVGALGGNKVSISVPFTREANATPYTAGDVISAAAATVVPAMGFATAGRVVAGSGYVVGACLAVNVKSVTPRTRIHLFNINTATVAGDNLQWRELYADISKRIGYFDLPAMSTGADTANSDMSRSLAFDFRIPYICAAASQYVYAVIETLDAVTLTSGSALTLTLLFEQD